MLFRQAALDAQRHQSIGRIVLVRPVTFAFLTALAIAIATLILAFLALGQYTKRAHVQGLLVPETGLIHVESPTGGLVEQQNVREGQSVEAGQVLFVLNTERQMGLATALWFPLARRSKNHCKTAHRVFRKKAANRPS